MAPARHPVQVLRALARRHRRPIAIGAGLLAGLVVGVLAVNLYVVLRAGGAATDVSQVRHAQVAIVPGALVDPQGRMSAMLRDRVDGAVRLYRAGRVDRILVSGDHGRLGYDETDTMRDAVLARGVPARDVFTDYAGFDTWSTVVRARRVFRVRSAVIVTQGFHMARALFLARRAGLDAQGLVAGRDGYGRRGTQAALREVVARVKGAEQATVRPGVLLGPALPITGDGRTSWGPADPLAP